MKKYSVSIISIALFFLFGTNGISQYYQMTEVAGGTFEMGATPEQLAASYPKEKPAHSVQLSDFMIGIHEVTQAEWAGIMNDNPSLNVNSGNVNPVDYVDWMSAIIFCNEYTKADPSFGPADRVYYKDAAFTNAFGMNDYLGEGNAASVEVYIDYSKSGYRLPTEAEWEYAARGGAVALPTLYAGGDNMDNVGLYTDNSDWKTYPVGSKLPNELGIFDMSGNVWEMVNDWFGGYTPSPSVNPKGPNSGSHRILRGGGYDFSERMCRVSTRYMVLPDDKDSDIGFRMARNK